MFYYIIELVYFVYVYYCYRNSISNSNFFDLILSLINSSLLHIFLHNFQLKKKFSKLFLFDYYYVYFQWGEMAEWTKASDC